MEMVQGHKLISSRDETMPHSNGAMCTKYQHCHHGIYKLILSTLIEYRAEVNEYWTPPYCGWALPPLTYFALLLQNYLFTRFRNVSLNWISAVILLADRCYNCLCLCLPDIVEVTLSHISAPLQGIVNRWFMLKMSQIKCSKTTNMLEITR